MSSRWLLTLALLVTACSNRSPAGDSSQQQNGNKAIAQLGEGRPPIAPLVADRCLPIYQCGVPQKRCTRVDGGATPSVRDPGWELLRTSPGDSSAHESVTFTFDSVETQARCRRRPKTRPPSVGCALVDSSCQIRPGQSVQASACSSGHGTAKVAVKRVEFIMDPMRRVFLDLELKNPSESDRWFLIGYWLDRNWIASASSITVRALGQDQGELYVFEGGYDFVAVRVAANSTLVLQDLPTKSSEELPENLHILVSSAPEIRIGDKLVEEHLDRAPTAARGTVNAHYSLVPGSTGPDLKITDFAQVATAVPARLDMPGLCLIDTGPEA